MSMTQNALMMAPGSSMSVIRRDGEHAGETSGLRRQPLGRRQRDRDDRSDHGEREADPAWPPAVNILRPMRADGSPPP